MKRLFATLAFVAIYNAVTLQAALTVPVGPWQQIANPIVLGDNGGLGPSEKIASSVNNNLTNTAYWNNSTWDSGTPDPVVNTNGDCRNIGCFITGADANASDKAQFQTNFSPTFWNQANYLGNNNGSAIDNIYFQAIPTTPATLISEIAGKAAGNWMGWYKQGVSSFTAGTKGTDWDVIFVGSDGPGASKAWTPSYNFGLWMLPNFSTVAASDAAVAAALSPGGQADRRFTEDSKNGAGAGALQYFTLFAKNAASVDVTPTTYIIGIEDDSFTTGADGDYNDMIFSITVVPEPGYYVVLSLGLLALGVARRRMKTVVN